MEKRKLSMKNMIVDKIQKFTSSGYFYDDSSAIKMKILYILNNTRNHEISAVDQKLTDPSDSPHANI
ncbi:hypothetical protein MXB_965 [Myxobolus squamalis]|nr:hypothetical protein MXB_965 [Myxobolus squamalis]